MQYSTQEQGSKAWGVSQRVAPLFETLADLDNAGKVMRRLFSVPWYREQLRSGFVYAEHLFRHTEHHPPGMFDPSDTPACIYTVAHKSTPMLSKRTTIAIHQCLDKIIIKLTTESVSRCWILFWSFVETSPCFSSACS